ncbi:hypothetical protein BGZ63DRAFT_399986 [Mariannaea sp. PMI_226]|nr:hypothetical protein BGZ63DRAFT_399986 [Mariannaea sp. PMI_226]
MASNGNLPSSTQHKETLGQHQAVPPPAASESSATTSGNNISKDEVGWYFVEQYYTTLSKSPEKLHLFYSKRSQFVYGLEAEVANVSVGRQAIQERIKALDFQDCKVRVSNVDSQASVDNIVIQVIGETSNKAGEPKKFVQTFVLAQQPSGYFVLNDILRYIDDETDDESAAAVEETVEEPEAAAQPAPAVEAEEAKPTEETQEVLAEETKEVPAELEVDAVDEKLEAAASKDSATLNGSSTEDSFEEPKVSETKPEVPAVDPEATVKELAAEDALEAEKPKDPTPTPVAKPIPTPAEPPAPTKPMTWASRAAAAAGPKPVVPLSKTPTPPVTAQNRAPAPVAPTSQPAAAAAPAATAPAAAPSSAAEGAKDNAGWQTAGADSKRQNRPHSISNAPAEKEGPHGYVKYVTEKVQEADLRAALAAHGELTYFDINRQKNCAFVEYKTPEGYQAAVAANPHIVNGENIVVEPRRPKAGAYGGSGFGSGRGGAARGRGFDGNRSGSQGGARGNFPGQNRGRGGAARGRGGAQATNA